MVFLAGKLPDIRSNTVKICGFGQPYLCVHAAAFTTDYAGTIHQEPNACLKAGALSGLQFLQERGFGLI
jgi:hypothetical protein